MIPFLTSALILLAVLFTQTAPRQRIADPSNLPQVVTVLTHRSMCSGAIVVGPTQNYVVTAAHCMDGTKPMVVFSDGSERIFEVAVVGQPEGGRETDLDFAILKGDTGGRGGLMPSSDEKPYPYVGLYYSMRTGTQMAMPFAAQNVLAERGGIKIVAIFNHGDSGGPMVDNNHELVAIVSAMRLSEEQGFACPVSGIIRALRGLK